MQKKLNAIGEQNIGAATNVIEGTFQLLQFDVKVSIDPGASHSYIAQSLAHKLDLNSTHLLYTLEVNTPLGRVGRFK